jgi:hypothetical protein
MPLHTWRRQHGPDIVAEVSPIKGLGQWDACAWLVKDPSAVAKSPRKIAALMSAQAAADHLARTTFDHTCDPHGCGDWMFWPQN